MYFETPDLRNVKIKKGWSGMGDVNRPRLEQFAEYLAAARQLAGNPHP